MRRLLSLALLLAACGGGGGGAASPAATLPEVRAEQPPPAPSPAEAAAPADPWAGRTDLIQPPPPAKPAAVNIAKVERFTLPNGLKVMVVASHDLPIVGMNLAVGAGEEDEPRDKRLIAQFAAAMLTKGTRERGADDIAGRMDFIGGDLGASADLESTYVTCEVLARDLATCLTLLPEIVIQPAFPAGEMPRVADQLVGGLKQIRDAPDALARQHVDNLLWGEDHVRGWPPTVEGVRAISRDDLIAWHRARFVPGNAVLAVAGDVDPKQLRADLQRVFAPWKGRAAPAGKKYREPRLKGLRVRLVDNPALSQSQIIIAGLGVAHADKDYLPTVLMNYALGAGGFSSRLQIAVRVKGGKAYDASSDVERWRTRGEFAAAALTRTPETAATLQTMREEIGRMRTGGPTAEELAAAKANVAGNYPGRFQGAGDVARAVLAAELHGLGEAYVREFPLRIDAVTLEQVRAAAAAHLDADDAVVVIVGKADEVAPQLEQAGIAFERVGYLDPISSRDRAAKPVAPDAARADAGKKLLDAALAAKGGAARLRAIKDIKATGKVKLSLGGQDLEGDWTRLFVLPDRQRLDVSLPKYKQTIAMAVSPQGAWQQMSGTVHDLPAPLAEQARAGLWRDHDFILLRHLDAGTVVLDAGKTRVADKDYDTVIVRQADGKNETRILLDPRTHLVFRLLYSEGGAPGVEEYGDYRPVDGVMLPFRQHAQGAGQAFDITVTEFKIDAGIPGDAFKRP